MQRRYSNKNKKPNRCSSWQADEEQDIKTGNPNSNKLRGSEEQGVTQGEPNRRADKTARGNTQVKRAHTEGGGDGVKHIRAEQVIANGGKPTGAGGGTAADIRGR